MHFDVEYIRCIKACYTFIFCHMLARPIPARRSVTTEEDDVFMNEETGSTNSTFNKLQAPFKIFAGATCCIRYQGE